MAFTSFDWCEGEGDEGAMEKKLGEFFGPSHVDQAIRSAVQVCWMALPKDRRNVDEVEKEIRRIVDRALASMREDADAFRRPNSAPTTDKPALE